jgi:hypothetical protein
MLRSLDNLHTLSSPWPSSARDGLSVLHRSVSSSPPRWVARSEQQPAMTSLELGLSTAVLGPEAGTATLILKRPHVEHASSASTSACKSYRSVRLRTSRPRISTEGTSREGVALDPDHPSSASRVQLCSSLIVSCTHSIPLSP